MHVNDNKDGTVTVDMSYADFMIMLITKNEQEEDLKAIKDIIYELLQKIGFIGDDGEVRSVINMKMILAIAMKATTGDKKFKEEMSFLANAIPLIEKYKDL